MQAHMTKIVERYQQMVDRMRKELPRFHDETSVELGGAFRACASMQVRELHFRTIRQSGRLVGQCVVHLSFRLVQY
jgi:hypothetical protein